MIKNVIKRDGTSAPFDAEKIKSGILAAGSEGGVVSERAEEVADIVTRAVFKHLEGREDVPTSEIRERILAELDQVEPAIAEAWRAHDDKRGKE